MKRITEKNSRNEREISLENIFRLSEIQLRGNFDYLGLVFKL